MLQSINLGRHIYKFSNFVFSYLYFVSIASCSFTRPVSSTLAGQYQEKKDPNKRIVLRDNGTYAYTHPGNVSYGLWHLDERNIMLNSYYSVLMRYFNAEEVKKNDEFTRFLFQDMDGNGLMGCKAVLSNGIEVNDYKLSKDSIYIDSSGFGEIQILGNGYYFGAFSPKDYASTFVIRMPGVSQVLFEKFEIFDDVMIKVKRNRIKFSGKNFKKVRTE